MSDFQEVHDVEKYQDMYRQDDIKPVYQNEEENEESTKKIHYYKDEELNDVQIPSGDDHIELTGKYGQGAGQIDLMEHDNFYDDDDIQSDHEVQSEKVSDVIPEIQDEELQSDVTSEIISDEEVQSETTNENSSDEDEFHKEVQSELTSELPSNEEEFYEEEELQEEQQNETIPTLFTRQEEMSQLIEGTQSFKEKVESLYTELGDAKINEKMTVDRRNDIVDQIIRTIKDYDFKTHRLIQEIEKSALDLNQHKIALQLDFSTFDRISGINSHTSLSTDDIDFNQLH